MASPDYILRQAMVSHAIWVADLSLILCPVACWLAKIFIRYMAGVTMRSKTLVTLLFVGFCSMAVLLSTAAGPAPQTEKQKWEYHFESGYPENFKNDGTFDKLGADGWELVSTTVDPTRPNSAPTYWWYFKRPR
jgi:hypothetical protein